MRAQVKAVESGCLGLQVLLGRGAFAFASDARPGRPVIHEHVGVLRSARRQLVRDWVAGHAVRHLRI